MARPTILRCFDLFLLFAPWRLGVKTSGQCFRFSEAEGRKWCAERGYHDVLTATHDDVLMPEMRTTVTLDADTEALLRQQMALRRLTFKRALNDAIRRGLRAVSKKGRRSYQVKPFRSGYQPGVDRLRLNQLAGELETEEFFRTRNRSQ